MVYSLSDVQQALHRNNITEIKHIVILPLHGTVLSKIAKVATNFKLTPVYHL